MRKSRFTEARIIGMIKEQEAGMPPAEMCRRHGLSPATFYKLKSKHGGIEVSEAARPEEVEDGNAKLKRLRAETMRDNVVLKDLLERTDDIDQAARGSAEEVWGFWVTRPGQAARF